MNRKSLILFCASLLMLFVLAACSSGNSSSEGTTNSKGNTSTDSSEQSSDSQGSDKDTLTIAISENISTLDPHNQSSTFDIEVGQTMYESLVKLNKNQRLNQNLQQIIR